MVFLWKDFPIAILVTSLLGFYNFFIEYHSSFLYKHCDRGYYGLAVWYYLVFRMVLGVCKLLSLAVLIPSKKNSNYAALVSKTSFYEALSACNFFLFSTVGASAYIVDLYRTCYVETALEKVLPYFICEVVSLVVFASVSLVRILAIWTGQTQSWFYLAWRMFLNDFTC